MIKLIMDKKIFYNYKNNFKNSEVTNTSNRELKDIKKNVDINKLLNRVKIKEKNEKKNLIIYISLILLSIGLAWSIIFF